MHTLYETRIKYERCDIQIYLVYLHPQRYVLKITIYLIQNQNDRHTWEQNQLHFVGTKFFGVHHAQTIHHFESKKKKQNQITHIFKLYNCGVNIYLHVNKAQYSPHYNRRNQKRNLLSDCPTL